MISIDTSWTYNSHLDLDIHKLDNCQTDYLEVRDGYWMKSKSLGRFCGTGKTNSTVLSSGPRLLVHYVSTARQQIHKGFTAYYEGELLNIPKFVHTYVSCRSLKICRLFSRVRWRVRTRCRGTFRISKLSRRLSTE